MQALRQMGGGLIIAFISLLLVIGGISLALAESSLSLPPTPTPLPPPILPPELFAPTFITTNTIEAPATNTATSSPGATMATASPTACPPPGGWLQIIVSMNDTLYTLAEKYKTTAETLSAANCLTTFEPPQGSLVYVPPVPTVTIIPCGPPAGWVRTHFVQPGENLFRIALSYGVTVQQLQRANCMGTSTIIYAGQRLWVPNAPTRTPGVTIVPTTPTSTPTATQPPSPTSTFIATATEPTATFIHTATSTPSQ
jgi:LysM repeat protein